MAAQNSAKKVVRKRRERKNVEKGQVHIQATFNNTIVTVTDMAGNAIYYALLAIFFAQFYEIDLGMAEYVSITIVCTLGAIGQAGVPGPTLLAAAVLVAAGIPLEGLPLFYALDRIFDMIRTTLNITGDAACAAVVDRFVKK